MIFLQLAANNASMDMTWALSVQRLVENVSVCSVESVEKCERASLACRANMSFCSLLLLSCDQRLCFLHLHTWEQNITLLALLATMNMKFQSYNFDAKQNADLNP